MKFTLDDNHRAELEKLANSGMTPVLIAQRAKILLLKDAGKSATAIADEVGVSRHTAELWIKKYRTRSEEDSIEDLLNVSKGRGRKEEITGEAKTWLISVACTQPKDFGYAAETWTTKDVKVDGNTITTYVPGDMMPNDDLKWETTISRNLGIDFGFLNRIRGSVEFYWNTTKDILMQVPVDASTGYAYQYQNVGETSNKGIELSLAVDIIKKKDFIQGLAQPKRDKVEKYSCLYKLMVIPFLGAMPKTTSVLDFGCGKGLSKNWLNVELIAFTVVSDGIR